MKSPGSLTEILYYKQRAWIARGITSIFKNIWKLILFYIWGYQEDNSFISGLTSIVSLFVILQKIKARHKQEVQEISTW